MGKSAKTVLWLLLPAEIEFCFFIVKNYFCQFPRYEIVIKLNPMFVSSSPNCCLLLCVLCAKCFPFRTTEQSNWLSIVGNGDAELWKSHSAWNDVARYTAKPICGGMYLSLNVPTLLLRLLTEKFCFPQMNVD